MLVTWFASLASFGLWTISSVAFRFHRRSHIATIHSPVWGDCRMFTCQTVGSMRLTDETSQVYTQSPTTWTNWVCSYMSSYLTNITEYVNISTVKLRVQGSNPFWYGRPVWWWQSALFSCYYRVSLEYAYNRNSLIEHGFNKHSFKIIYDELTVINGWIMLHELQT